MSLWSNCCKLMETQWPYSSIKRKELFNPPKWYFYLTCCCYCLLLSCVQLILACQAPLSLGFSRQEYWSGLPCPSPGNLPNPGIEPRSPALTGRFFFFFNHWATREAYINLHHVSNISQKTLTSRNLISY